MDNKNDILDTMDKGINTTPDTNVLGWIDIDKKDISYGGRLYPKKWSFKVKPATVAEIRHYSSLDENNLQSVLNGIETMLRSNVRVSDGSKFISVDNIYDHDKFMFILYIQMISNVGKKLTFEHTCKKCNTQQAVEICSNNLMFSDLGDKATKYLSNGYFNIKTKSFGNIKMKPLTILDRKLLNGFINEHYEKTNEKIESSFLYIVPFLINNDDNYSFSSLYQDYLALSKEKFNLFFNLYNKYFDIRLMETLDVECETCKCGIRPSLQFPRGLANIFFDDNTDEELI